jgi:hypothetical protein
MFDFFRISNQNSSHVLGLISEIFLRNVIDETP